MSVKVMAGKSYVMLFTLPGWVSNNS